RPGPATGRRLRAELVHEAGAHEPAGGRARLRRSRRPAVGHDALGHIRTVPGTAARPGPPRGGSVDRRRPAARGPRGPRGRRKPGDVAVPQPLDTALAEIRTALLDPAGLRRAVAAGRRRGHHPSLVRAELRPVALK